MRFLITVFLIFVFVFNCNAQSITAGHPAFGKIKLLQKGNIDTIVLYYKSCRNQVFIETDDNCTEDDARYVFWTDGDKSYVQKFDRCKVYELKTIISPILNLVKRHYALIEKQTFKRFSETKIINSNSISTEVLNPTHGCTTSYEIYTANKVMIKYIEPMPLTIRYDRYINENFDYNKNLLIAQLSELLADQVNNYNK